MNKHYANVADTLGKFEPYIIHREATFLPCWVELMTWDGIIYAKGNIVCFNTTIRGFIYRGLGLHQAEWENFRVEPIKEKYSTHLRVQFDNVEFGIQYCEFKRVWIDTSKLSRYIQKKVGLICIDNKRKRDEGEECKCCVEDGSNKYLYL